VIRRFAAIYWSCELQMLGSIVANTTQIECMLVDNRLLILASVMIDDDGEMIMMAVRFHSVI
jgi:hypothetical protein